MNNLNENFLDDNDLNLQINFACVVYAKVSDILKLKTFLKENGYIVRYQKPSKGFLKIVSEEMQP